MQVFLDQIWLVEGFVSDLLESQGRKVRLVHPSTVDFIHYFIDFFPYFLLLLFELLLCQLFDRQILSPHSQNFLFCQVLFGHLLFLTLDFPAGTFNLLGLFLLRRLVAPLRVVEVDSRVLHVLLKLLEFLFLVLVMFPFLLAPHPPVHMLNRVVSAVHRISQGKVPGHEVAPEAQRQGDVPIQLHLHHLVRKEHEVKPEQLAQLQVSVRLELDLVDQLHVGFF